MRLILFFPLFFLGGFSFLEARRLQVANECPSNTGSIYTIVIDSVTFEQARTACAALDPDKGSVLTAVRSEEEFNKITALMDEAGVNDLWIGVEDVDPNLSGQITSRFSFVSDDQTGVEFINDKARGDFPWGSSQPNGQNDNCVTIRDFGSSLKAFDDRACDSIRNGFICSTSCFTVSPTKSPSLAPTISPTPEPTPLPTTKPTRNPSTSPTPTPTKNPTTSPSGTPTTSPTTTPTKNPTKNPTTSPTTTPTQNPTISPTTSVPTTSVPTTSPTTPVPTTSPTESPTKNPTISPTTKPTKSPTTTPTSSPSKNPTTSPSKNPTESPTSPFQTRCIDNDLISFQVQPRDFIDAESLCVRIGGYLARVRNLEEFVLVHELTNGTEAWIGVDARVTGSNSNPNNFVFTDGIIDDFSFFRVATGALPWDFNEPNETGKNNGDCVKLNANGRWNDVQCAELHSFVCRTVNSLECKLTTTAGYTFSVSLYATLSSLTVVLFLGSILLLLRLQRREREMRDQAR